ncbi:MAG TPA: SpoIIE family protein phosphatase [Desulfomonilaceae bacterium]|nr:SpoIIE family protein phosphatase [Desulfomonilaceae bacterium]
MQFGPSSSIMTKMTLLVSLGTLAVLAFVLVTSQIYTRDIILDNAQTSALNQAKSVARHLDVALASVATTTKNLAITLECGTWNETALLELLGRVVHQDEEMFGSAIAFEPHAFRADLKAYAPYYCKNGSGLKYMQLGNESYDYFIKDWYRIPRELKRSIWSAPYFDEGGADVLMTTFACPFFQENDFGDVKKIKGIVTADLSLERLTQMVSAVRVQKTGYAFLISEYGTILAHPNTAWVMRESMFSLAEETGDPVIAQAGRTMVHEGSGFIDIGRAMTGKDSFMAFARLPSTGWSLGVISPKNELLAELASLHRNIALLSIAGIALLLVVSFLVARSITSPLRRMAHATGKVAHGDLDIDLPDAGRADEIGQLASAFVHMTEDLKKYISDLTRTTAAKQRIESELSIAATIQKSMLPSKFPAFPGRDEFDIFALMRPAKEVGGDFYDFFLVDEQHLCVVVGDVSGKGVPASLFMAVTKYLVEAAAGESSRPDEILKKVNAQLARKNESCMFVTLFLGILDTRTGELLYANAGHNPPLLIAADGKNEFLGRPGGPILGVMDDAVFSMDRLVLKSGEVLLTYTDGVTEAADTEGRFFSENGIQHTIESLETRDVREISESLLTKIDSFCHGALQADDITILTLKFGSTAIRKS